MAVGSVEDIDLGYKKIVREYKKLDGSYTKVGLFGNSGGPENNLAARGAVHEYGTKSGKIPSRPFNRDAFDNNFKDLLRLIQKEMNSLLQEMSNATKMLKRLGEWFTGEVKESITIGRFVPLKEKTKKAKGSSRPLIDTGQMRGAITHKEKI